MIDIKLNGDGDVDIENYDASYVEKTALIEQQLKIRLRFFRGEWYSKKSFGMPYFQYIFRKNPNLGLVGSLFKRAILTTPGVKNLVSFNIETNSARDLTVKYEVSTDYTNIKMVI